jgi:invasion protein IalB
LLAEGSTLNRDSPALTTGVTIDNGDECGCTASSIVDNDLKLVLSLAEETGFTFFRDRRRKTGSLPVSPAGEGFSKGVARAFISI